jgi:hypothetical protein
MGKLWRPEEYKYLISPSYIIIYRKSLCFQLRLQTSLDAITRRCKDLEAETRSQENKIASLQSELHGYEVNLTENRQKYHRHF